MMEHGRRPHLPPVSEEMKAWSEALAGEITGWPQVSTRSFFGFTALFRKDRIFALLPRTRGMESANSLAFRLESPSSATLIRVGKDSRVASTRMQKARWFTFEISSDSDLHDALDWLAWAYDEAGKKSKSR
jgi:hypothetical protein